MGEMQVFLRIDMPGHLKHKAGDDFSEIYLSYRGRIPSSEFLKDFAPDEKFNYRRDRDGVTQRMIRAYHIRDPKTGPVAADSVRKELYRTLQASGRNLGDMHLTARRIDALVAAANHRNEIRNSPETAAANHKVAKKTPAKKRPTKRRG